MPKHLRFPISIANGGFAYDEQDSAEEILSAINVIVRAELGSHEDNEAFGIPDPTFQTRPVDTVPIEAAISTYEPRAAPLVQQYGDTLDESVENILIATDARKAQQEN